MMFAAACRVGCGGRSHGGARTIRTLLLALGSLVFVASGLGASRADEAADEAAATSVENGAEGESGDGGIGFPGDRLRERQFDKARRLVADGRWSDAATLCDEILGADRDFFFQADPGQRIWRSIKSETNRLIGSLDKQGRDAYVLQFRARAERMLAQAVAADDPAAIVAVARRWFHTPAGHAATILAATEALETNQPLAAAAWLDRLAETDTASSYEPAVSIMRAVAWLRAGERQTAAAIIERVRVDGRPMTRIGGQDVTMSFPAGGGLAWLETVAGAPSARAAVRAGEWAMHRGDPSRNGISLAARPLLAPRYRVPLARHPEESRLLDAGRRRRAEREIATLPAGSPLAVNGTILLHSNMGLLAVDFDTGKRIWLQTGGAAASAAARTGDEERAEDGEAEPSAAFTGAFEDLTSGTLSSDGSLVFVVESHPDAGGTRQAGGRFGQAVLPGGAAPSGWRGGNALSAYDLNARGRPRWRLPERGSPGSPWYLGAPLPLGGNLLVLVEEKGEIRLDVLDAGTGHVAWSQPLAELDEDRTIDQRDNAPRRLAGLSPALADGVLVCPTGAGAVIAVDLATRTLLWAHEYPQARRDGVVVLPNGIRVQRGNVLGGGILVDGGADRDARGGRWLDSAPVLAGGRVLLAPGESPELHCLDLRRGTTLWRLPRQDRLYVAGVVDGRVIVVGQRAVEAIDLASGRGLWQRPLGPDQGMPSGRGILTASRLLLPLDSPEVLEIDLADGRVASRTAARGNAVPGNLLAYRGEIISQGADSLDVFHQSVALESRIETALRADPQDAWALLWQGQLDLERGATEAGIAKVRTAHALQPARVSTDVVAAALLFGLRSDFARAAPLWREAVAMSDSPAAAAVALRITIDGFLRCGDFPQAWEAIRRLLPLSAAAQDPRLGSGPGLGPGAAGAAAGESLVEDGGDAFLRVAAARWIQGRIGDLHSRADPRLREEIDAFAVGEAARSDTPALMRECLDRFGNHPAALAARARLADALDAAAEAGRPGDETEAASLERDFLLLALARMAAGEERQRAAARVDAMRAGSVGSRGQPESGLGDAWPIGRVVQRRPTAGRRDTARAGEDDNLQFLRSRSVTVPVADSADSFVPGLQLSFDFHQQAGIAASDGYGRPIGEPFGARNRQGNSRVVPMLQPGMLDEASIVGRIVFIRSGAAVAAFALGTGGEGNRNRHLWTTSDAAAGAALRTDGVVMHVGGGRGPRPGSTPLGARISEPRAADAAGRREGVIDALATYSGVAIMADRTIKVLEPLSGRVVWQRQRLPAGGELIGDGEFLCVCPPGGRGSIVLAMADGRVVRSVDLPPAERRLAVAGRCILAVGPGNVEATGIGAPEAAGGAVGQRVRLDLHDPVDGRVISLGDFPAESRAAPAGAGRIAVVEPSGTLSLLDLAGGRAVFRTRLTDMPGGLELVQVLPWRDRYLVLVGRGETPEEQREIERLGVVTPLPGVPGRDMPQLVTGSLWAVGRDDGVMLWPVPATVLRHCLQHHAASELPVLLFARTIQAARDPERPRLSVLCLDKRTGHAVYVDDRFHGRSTSRGDFLAVGCGMSGDPEGHTISLAQGRRDGAEVVLEFAGGPAAPRPPFQAAASRSTATVDPLVEIEYWIKKALNWPLPF